VAIGGYLENRMSGGVQNVNLFTGTGNGSGQKRRVKNMYENMGFSSSTYPKQTCLKDFLDMHMKISNGVMQRNNWLENKYLFFDINSGCGVDRNGNPGSPMIFLECAKNNGISHRTLFIDKDNESILTLKKITGNDENVRCECGDQYDIIHDILKRPATERRYLGLLYTDPNGIFNHNLLSMFAGFKEFDRVDILVNCNSTAIKRLGSDRETLVERLSCIPKKHWLIREPIGRWQWTMLFGCNWAGYPELKKHKFYKINSNQGKQIFNRLNFTAKEVKKNPTQLTLNTLLQTSLNELENNQCNV